MASQSSRQGRCGRWLALVAGAVAGAAPAQPPAAPPQSIELAPVIVTARLREEPAQQVPASLAVVSGRALQDEGRTALGELDSRVAGLQLGDLNGTPALYLRGVGGGGRQVAFEPRAGVHVDGVFMNVPPLTDALLLDLARVEVLRGPQGSLFGQNTVAGTINLITREPGRAPSLQALARLGSSGEQRLLIAADTPLVDERVLLRVSGTLAQSRGETVNRVDSERLDAAQEAGGRARLLWLTAEGLRVDVAADFSRQSDDWPTGEALSSTNGMGPDANPGAYSVALNTPQRDDLSNQGLAATVRWQTALGELTSLSAWRASERRWAVDLDYSPADALRLDYIDRYRRLSQELRLASPDAGGPWRWLGGLYAYQQWADAHRPLLSGNDISRFVPPLSPGDQIIVEPDIRTRSAALFGSVGYALSDQLRADAGLRLLTLSRALRFTQLSTPGYQALGVRTIEDAQRRGSETAVLPDAALSWAFDPRATAYVRYARGSKAGGFDADVLGSGRTDPTAFGEETVSSYELGLKGSAFAERLSGSLAVFLADYRDYQVSQFRAVGNGLLASVTSNAGKVRSYGPELDLSARLLPGLTLRNSTAWLFSSYEEFKDGGGAGVDFSGRRTEFAPRLSMNTGLDYQRPVGGGALHAAVDFSWRSRFFTQPSNQPAFEADIRRLLGLRLGYQQLGGRLDTRLFVDNLLDARYFETLNRGTLGTLYGRYGAPRTFGAQIEYRPRSF